MGKGMPQNREGSRTDPNYVPRAPRPPKPPWVFPPVGPVIDDTHAALLDMEDTLLRHGTNVEGNVGTSEAGTSGAGMSGASTFGAGTSGARGFYTQDPHNRSLECIRAAYCNGDAEGSEHRVLPHHCISRGNICYGPISQFRDENLLQYVSKTHSIYMIFYFMS